MLRMAYVSQIPKAVIPRRRDFDYRIIPLPISGKISALSGAATSGMAVAFLAFLALPGFALRGFFAFARAFAFFAGARLAFFTLRLAAFLALTFFMDFFALRAMSQIPSLRWRALARRSYHRMATIVPLFSFEVR
jgi:hypothetical protein